MELTDEQISALASEDDQAIAERDRCQKLLTALQKSLDDLRRLQSARIDNRRPQVNREFPPSSYGIFLGQSSCMRLLSPPSKTISLAF